MGVDVVAGVDPIALVIAGEYLEQIETCSRLSNEWAYICNGGMFMSRITTSNSDF